MQLTTFIIDLGMTDNGPQIYEFGPMETSHQGSYEYITQRTIQEDVLALSEATGVPPLCGQRSGLLYETFRDKGVTALALQPFIQDVMPKTIGLAPMVGRGIQRSFEREVLLKREFPEKQIVIKSHEGTLGLEVQLTTTDDFDSDCHGLNGCVVDVGDGDICFERRITVQPRVIPQMVMRDGEAYLPTVRVWASVWKDTRGELQRHYHTAFYKFPSEPIDLGKSPSANFNRAGIVSATADIDAKLALPLDVANKLYAQLDAKFFPGLARFIDATPEELWAAIETIPHQDGFVQDNEWWGHRAPSLPKQDQRAFA